MENIKNKILFAIYLFFFGSGVIGNCYFIPKIIYYFCNIQENPDSVWFPIILFIEMFLIAYTGIQKEKNESKYKDELSMKIYKLEEELKKYKN